MRQIGELVFSTLIFIISLFMLLSGVVLAKDDEIETCIYQATRYGQNLCIRRETFNNDLCETLETLARAHHLPPDFFARLIWRESLFRPEAISPRGAEGIAQFMPGTARSRGLSNSFHVIAALDASAIYLSELHDRFGNFGLAAAAYNAGENGVTRFFSSGKLPVETRDYVFAITGNLAEKWRDDPPSNAAPALQDGKPFIDACITLASTRRMSEPVLPRSADWAPWGIQLSAHQSPSVANRLFTATILRLPSPLNAERALIVRQRGGNFGYRPRYAARIGKESRAEANKLCAAIRANGAACTVLANQ